MDQKTVIDQIKSFKAGLSEIEHVYYGNVSTW